MRDEMMASAVEVIDLWGRRWLTAQGLKQHLLPEAITIPRPQDEDAKALPSKVETDPVRIRQWFATRGNR